MSALRVLYSIDFMRILTRIPRDLLEDFLDIDELKGECVNIFVRYSSKVARRAGYKSSICVTAPAKRFFELLAFYDLGDYIISYLEAAKDELKSSMDEARFESYGLKWIMMKKYTLKPFTYDARNGAKKVNIDMDKGLYSDMTNYLGGKALKHVTYARISKLIDKPCIHMEWRIRGAGKIKKRTGISTIEDCIGFDAGQFYEETTAKYLYHAEINQDLLGKLLNGFDGRRQSFNDESLLGIRVAASIFMGFYSISSTAQLIDTLKKKQVTIKAKSGQRNKVQKRILALKSFRSLIESL